MDPGLKPSSSWTHKIVDSIIANRSQTAVQNFRRQPLANKLTALEDAIVQPRKDSTPDSIAAILQELVSMGALKPSEVGPMFSDLLIRVHKYNSTNVQSNLNVLLGDIRAAQSEAIRSTNVGELSNQVILNDFLSRLPPVVPMGQHNYEAFKQSLRLMVNEAPNVTLFKSGPDTMMQVNIRGVNTVNLNSAFSNLQNLWGVVLDSDRVPGSISSKLSSNTRVLLLFLAPFTNENTFTPDTFLWQIMQLYRETVAASIEAPLETEREVAETVRDMGGDIDDVGRTMAYLLKNKEEVMANPRTLSPRQLGVVRYVQESLMDRIDRNGEEPIDALRNIVFSFAPSYFEANGSFIRKLLSYLEVALRNSPNYFREIYSNKYWTPPPSFWTQNYGDFFVEREAEAEREALEEAGPRESYSFLEDPSSSPQSSKIQSLGTCGMTMLRPMSPSVPPTPSVRSAPPSVSYGGPSRSSLSVDSASNRNFGATLARAVLPSAAAAIGNAAGEALYPSLGQFLAPAASLAATRFLSGNRGERIKRQRQRRRAEIERRRIAELTPPSPAPSLSSESSAPSLSSVRTSYTPLAGAKYWNPVDDPEGDRDVSGTGLGNPFDYLRPRNGLK
ncbi:pIIIa [Snake adenovirus 1]|uniref:Pre-hexon-linking protein IIIa n=1 Tax=Snake adenovirus serotype 1 TaxID=189830 RepID=CAP3_ADES1|nr:pIIIa [Snake adenovirus 1]A9CB89.1 RecName: Full=Pre-hexon-linking protein IIIa; AltName: Full=Capsid vertex-specific component IIIa; Short=CVSC; AltName: Full=Protein IIIa; AltName: Full=pIIIa; Contains: RecName: Full=Hexon-linking protein IIIa [Snake adenovirus 1]ABA47239.1 pIIIa [Snake adenovirus 1]